jgi:hypothetical protein
MKNHKSTSPDHAEKSQQEKQLPLNSEEKYAIMTVYSKIQWTWQPIFFSWLVRWG